MRSVLFPNSLGHVVGIRNAEEPIKPLASWQELWLVTQVPFSNQCGGVVLLLENFRDRDLVRMQTIGRDRSQNRTVSIVQVHADPLCIASSHDAGT